MSTHSMTGGRTSPGDETAFFQEHGRTPAPKLVQWMATLRCDLACPHCLAADGPEMADMPLDRVERLLDQIAGMGTREFLVTGGEPACRPDLPEVVAMLGRRGINWTLNTAVSPGQRLRAAMKEYPPRFVAVSLDGPERVHDRFRGRAGAYRDALEAIRFYREVCRGGVVAGTTVTARNWRHLHETFAEVVGSGATGWGLHLLVPEGRAARDRRLFLSRRQLRELVAFCASRRKHFPVEMADEIGYLGEREPLVREAPFFCSAGRTQCVVLPDGEVVPCTTLDRRASAGNVFREGLAGIWERGFAALRSWEPEGRCRSCEYAPACRGGCWLQRKSGTACFRPVWAAPRLAAALGGAACLGLLSACASQAGEPRKEPSGKVEKKPTVKAKAPVRPAPDRKHATERSAIINWYAAGTYGGRRAPTVAELRKRVEASDYGKTPAGRYFLDFTAAKRARDLGSRCRAVKAGMGKGEFSLSMSALMWRDLVEACLDGKGPSARDAKTRKALRETLAELAAASRKAYVKRWDTVLYWYVKTGAVPGYGLRSKAIIPSREIGASIGRNRWGKLKKYGKKYAEAYPFGEGLALEARCGKEAGMVRLGVGKDEKFAGKFKLRIFDVVKLAKSSRVQLSSGPDEVSVTLPAGGELVYADILRLAGEQNREKLEKAARGRHRSLEPRPLLLPALRAAAGKEKTWRARRRLMALWLF